MSAGCSEIPLNSDKSRKLAPYTPHSHTHIPTHPHTTPTMIIHTPDTHTGTPHTHTRAHTHAHTHTHTHTYAHTQNLIFGTLDHSKMLPGDF